jgi:hypothetical protein
MSCSPTEGTAVIHCIDTGAEVADAVGVLYNWRTGTEVGRGPTPYTVCAPPGYYGFFVIYKGAQQERDDYIMAGQTTVKSMDFTGVKQGVMRKFTLRNSGAENSTYGTSNGKYNTPGTYLIPDGTSFWINFNYIPSDIAISYWMLDGVSQGLNPQYFLTFDRDHDLCTYFLPLPNNPNQTPAFDICPCTPCQVCSTPPADWRWLIALLGGLGGGALLGNYLKTRKQHKRKK